MLFREIGQCIYCGCDSSPLSDEHIIPLSLNGILLLPKASCRNCADATSKFEQTVARTIYGVFRLKHGFKTRHKRNQPKHIPVQVAAPDGQLVIHNLPLADHPSTYIVVEFPPPGVLTGEPLSDRNPPFRFTLKTDLPAFKAAIEKLGADNMSIAGVFPWAPFMRVLAKIGHAYLAGVVGLSGYTPLLTNLALGKSDYLSHLIGGVASPLPSHLGDLSLMTYSRDNEHYLAVYIRLLGGRLPVYQAIAGRATSAQMEVIAAKLRCQPQV